MSFNNSAKIAKEKQLMWPIAEVAHCSEPRHGVSCILLTKSFKAIQRLTLSVRHLLIFTKNEHTSSSNCTYLKVPGK